MKITINARDSKITAGMEEKVMKKFHFLDKYLKESDEVNVFIKKGRLNHKVKVVMPTINHETMVVKHEDNDFYVCVDVLADKVKEVYLQNKKKYLDNKKKGVKKSEMDTEIEPIFYEEGDVEYMEPISSDVVSLKYN